MKVDEIAAYERKTAPAMTGRKIAILDIERVKGRFAGEFFDPNDMKGRRIPHDWVTEPPRTICFAYRWYGEDEIHTYAEWDKGGWAKMHRQAWKVYDQAQIVVGHYLPKFDTPKLRNGWLRLGLPDPSPWKEVDTWRVALRLGFEYNGLDALCKELGIPAKTDHYDPLVARAAVDGDREAQARIVAYNAGDVEANTWLLDRFRGHIPGHPHDVDGTINDRPVCNQCWSDNLDRDGIVLARQIAYVNYRCGDCGASVRGTRHSRAAVTTGVRS